MAVNVAVLLQYRAWQQRGHFFIQMDLAEHGSLGSLIRQVRLPSAGASCAQPATVHACMSISVISF